MINRQLSDSQARSGNFVPGGSALAQAIRTHQQQQQQAQRSTAAPLAGVTSASSAPAPRAKRSSSSSNGSSYSSSSASSSSYYSTNYNTSSYSTPSYSSRYVESAEEIAKRKAAESAKEKLRAELESKREAKLQNLRAACEVLKSFDMTAGVRKLLIAKFGKEGFERFLEVGASDEALNKMFKFYFEQNAKIEGVSARGIFDFLREAKLESESLLNAANGYLRQSGIYGVERSMEDLADLVLPYLDQMTIALKKAAELLKSQEQKKLTLEAFNSIDLTSLTEAQKNSLISSIGQEAYDALVSEDKNAAFIAFLKHYVANLSDSPFSSEGVQAIQGFAEIKNASVSKIFEAAYSTLIKPENRADGKKAYKTQVAIDLSDIFAGLNKALLGAIELLKGGVEIGDGLKAELPVTEGKSNQRDNANKPVSTSISATTSSSVSQSSFAGSSSVVSKSTTVAQGSSINFAFSNCCKIALPIIVALIAAGVYYVNETASQQREFENV